MAEEKKSDPDVEVKNLDLKVNNLSTLSQSIEKQIKQFEDVRKNELETIHSENFKNKTLLENYVNNKKLLNDINYKRILLIFFSYLIMSLFYYFFIYNYFVNNYNIINYVINIPFLIISYIIVNNFYYDRNIYEINIRNEYIEKELNDSNNLLFGKIQKWNLNNSVNIIKSNITNFISISTTFIPTIGKIKKLLESQNYSHSIFNSIDILLIRYNFTEDEIREVHSELINNVLYEFNKDELERIYLSIASNKLKLNEYILSLLYYDFFIKTNNITYFWEKLKLNITNLKEYIYTIKKHQIINFYNLTDDECLIICSKLDKYTLSKIENGFKNYSNIKDILNYINEKGIKEKIFVCEHYFNPIFNNIIFNDKIEKEDLYEIILKNLTENGLKEALCKVLLGITSSETIPYLKEISSIKIGYDEDSTDLLFLYIKMKEEDNKISLKEVLTKEISYLNSIKQDKISVYNKFKVSLQEGHWITSLYYVFFQIFESLEQTNISLKHSIENERAIKEVAKTFLSQKIIMHVLESNTLIAYIIMAKTEEGNLMPILDELAEGKNRNLFWLEKYTTSSRIGILPPGITFNKFCDKLKDELFPYSNEVVSNILIHRFPVSDFNSMQITIGSPYESSWTMIKRLILSHIDIDKISIYLRYSDFINESFYNKSFFEFIRDYIYDNFDYKKKELEEIISNKDIIKEILKEFNQLDMKNLLIFIHNNKNKQNIINRINNILNMNYPIVDKNILYELSESFYNKLISLATYITLTNPLA